MIYNDAKYFAIAAHSAIGQKRKYTGEPYWHHPERVVEIVSSVEHTPEMIAAAWLHDVVEDTEVSIEEIVEHFGSEIAGIVRVLTKPSWIKGLDNKHIPEAYNQRLSEAGYKVQTIKLADLIDNTSTIVKLDPKFAKVYLKEKRDLLDVIAHGNSDLWDTANKLSQKNVSHTT